LAFGFIIQGDFLINLILLDFSKENRISCGLSAAPKVARVSLGFCTRLALIATRPANTG